MTAIIEGAAPEPVAAVDDARDVRPVVEFAQADSGTPAVAARVIVVASPKGGQGKTTMATNLAVALARVAPGSVVLVDADMQFGDVAHTLDLAPTHTLPDLVADAVLQDPIVLKTLLTPHPEAFYVVPGAASPVAGARVTDGQLSRLLAQLAGLFRFVIVDTTPGLGEHTLSAMDNATDAVFVTGLAVPNLRAMRTELDVLDSIGAVPPQRFVVLNMADERAGMRTKDAETILGARLSVVIPRSTAVPLAANRGIPVLIDAPRDGASKALLQLIPHLLAGLDPKVLRSRPRKVVT